MRRASPPCGDAQRLAYGLVGESAKFEECEVLMGIDDGGSVGGDPVGGRSGHGSSIRGVPRALWQRDREIRTALHETMVLWSMTVQGGPLFDSIRNHWEFTWDSP